MNQTSLWDDGGRTHWDDPWTSETAARAVPRAKQRHRVLLALATAGESGRTDSELGQELHIRETAAGTRRKELEEMGLVERTPHTRLTVYGNPALVHRITDTGRRILGLVDWEAS